MVTARKEQAVAGFPLGAFDYSIKPYQESRISSVVQMLEAG